MNKKQNKTKQYSVALLIISAVRNHTFEKDFRKLISPILYPRLFYTRNKLGPYKPIFVMLGHTPLGIPFMFSALCSHAESILLFVMGHEFQFLYRPNKISNLVLP